MKSVAFVLLLGLLAFCAELTLTSGQPGFCRLPPDHGPCRGNFPHYFYNRASKKCERFIYGGCQGNKNNFKTLEKCHYTCIEKPGKCPVPPPGTAAPCIVKCDSDWSCPGRQKCCSWACLKDCFGPV